jgi:hypothetical protein
MRIVALEKEVARYKAQVEATPVQQNSELSGAELLQKIDTLEKVWIQANFVDYLAKQNTKRRASCPRIGLQ